MACFLRGRWGIHKALSGIHKRAFHKPLFESGLPASENVSRSKVAHLLPKARTCKVDYNNDVRYYTTKPINGGAFCRPGVNPLDFKGTNGSRRIPAAAVMNQHAAAFDFSCLRPDRGRSRRS
jgi:hypothetical protein